MTRPRVKANTPFDEWPLQLTAREVAVLQGRSHKAVLHALRQGRMWPPPVSDDHGFLKPYRFDRELVHAAMWGKLSRPRRLRRAA